MNPIHIVPWENDFLDAVAELLVRDHLDSGRGMQDYTVVFPHRRPGRYLREKFLRDSRIAKPCLAPDMIAVNSLFVRLGAETGQAPVKIADTLDQAGLLFECVREMAREHEGPLSRLPVADPREFFPWGMRLASLLEELFRHNTEPQSIHHLEERVMPFAAALLGQLGRIYNRYTESLDERQWSTPGFTAFRVARNPDLIVSALSNKKVILAGSYALSGSEEVLYRTLWERGGAEVMLHSDPALGQGAKAHWSCEEHRRMLRRWNASPVLFSPAEKRDRSIRYFECFDLHSQLAAMEQELRASGPDAPVDTAIVLPDTTMLMPVLHHLPFKDVNISMGFPLTRSTLYRLLENLMRSREDSRENGLRHWSEIIECIRHPYIKMLSKDGETSLRPVLRAMEEAIRGGGKYLAPSAWFADWFPDWRGRQAEEGENSPVASYSREALDGCGQLLESILDLCFDRWQDLSSLRDLARVLGDLSDLLITHGRDMWDRFPVDGECLYRLTQTVLPAIGQSTLLNLKYPPEVLFTILRELMDRERAPFEAEPLTGLQVLGMLEARLLRFKTVYLLGATDDALPGGAALNPLLPEPLRHLLALPDNRRRDQVAAYNFHRLLQGAEQVRILYQTGVEGGGLMERKSERSRFVEELLWKEEQRQGQVFEDEEGPVSKISYPLRPIPRLVRSVPKTPAMAEILAEYLKKPVSPSELNSYLLCPAKYFYDHLAGLKPVKDIDEQGDTGKLGTLVHDILCEFFTPYINKYVGGPDSPLPDSKSLQDLYLKRLRASDLYQRIPFDRKIMLEETGKYRLAAYRENMIPGTVKLLERTMEASLETKAGKHWLKGQLDRVDERDEGVMILEYKTGKIFLPTEDPWSQDEIWGALDNSPGDPELLNTLAKSFPSVQLCCYLHLYDANSEIPPLNAALVELQESGKERALFKKIPPQDREAIISEQIPALLSYLVEHLIECESFQARPGRYCDKCPHLNGCRSG